MPGDPILPRCVDRRCLHFEGVPDGEGEDEETDIMTCSAFPGGIPKRIAQGSDLHLTVASDQTGTDVYEQGPEE